MRLGGCDLVEAFEWSFQWGREWCEKRVGEGLTTLDTMKKTCVVKSVSLRV